MTKKPDRSLTTSGRGKPSKEMTMRIVPLVLIVGVMLGVSLVLSARAQDETTSSVIVFVEGSTVSSFSGSGDVWGSSVGGTTEPQTVEVMKQLHRFCPRVEVTSNRNAATYLILHERQAGGTFGETATTSPCSGKMMCCCTPTAPRSSTTA